jgi:hypothetical protein
MSISDGNGPRIVTLRRPVEERQFGDDVSVQIVFDADEASSLLHHLLAIYFGVSSAVALISPGGGLTARIEGGYSGQRAAINLSPRRLLIRSSEQELLYWCRFLTEVVLAISAVDHIDVEASELPHIGVVFRYAGEVVSVDEKEARRRLGL